MSLLFPPFYTRNEFKDLHPSLKAVQYGLRLEALQEELLEAEVARDTVLASYSKSDTVAKDQLLALMTEAMVPLEDGRRQAALRRILNEFKTLQASGMRHLSHQQIRDMIFRVFAHYQSLNYERFGADFAAVASQEDAELAAKAKEAEQTAVRAAKALERHLANVSRVFIAGKVPDAWEGISGPRTPEIVVREFLNRWRQRAPLFETPVSVSGVAIHTMEAERREIWGQAYKQLGLADIPKRPVYRFVIEPKLAKPTNIVVEEGLPPIFSEGNK